MSIKRRLDAGSVVTQAWLGDKNQSDNGVSAVALLRNVVMGLKLSANLGAHENNVGDTEADGD